jgi:type IV pilus assembly protein PilC
MPFFKYIATPPDSSRTINGVIEASDEKAALDMLRRQKLRPLGISSKSEKQSGIKIFFSTGRVKSSDLVAFTRQLSAMIGAGVPLLRALASLQTHTGSVVFKEILSSVIKDVQAGSALADALGKHPETFSSVYVNMVRAGENAGILDEILKRLALQQEKSASIKKKIRGAMAYPLTILFVTIVAFFGLMLFVVPQIGKVINDLGGGNVELPLLTRIMIGVSSFVASWWFILIPGLIVAFYLLFRFIKRPSGRRYLDVLALKIPLVKNIVRKVVVARLARTFAALSSAGLPILQSMNVTAHALGNSVYEDSLIQAAERVKGGELLSKVMEEDGLYPPIVPQMIAVGEETGETEAVLVKVAEFYEEEVDVALSGITSIIEPAVIVLLGGAVGLIAASVIGPIASLSQNIQ